MSGANAVKNYSHWRNETGCFYQSRILGLSGQSDCYERENINGGHASRRPLELASRIYFTLMSTPDNYLD